MPALPRAHLEALLRAKKLDHTLTSALPSFDSAGTAGPFDEFAIAPTGITALDMRLAGGFPRGHLSELTGPPSSGRTSLLLQMIATATKRGELAALIDAGDRFDAGSAAAAGIDLDRLLWIRGHVVSGAGPLDFLSRAVKALTLVLQAGRWGLVAFDVADVPPAALGRLPFTTWLRLQRIIEGSQTMCVLVGAEPMARSSAGLTLKLEARHSRFSSEDTRPSHARLFNDVHVEARIVRARNPRNPIYDDHLCVPLSIADARH